MIDCTVYFYIIKLKTEWKHEWCKWLNIIHTNIANYILDDKMTSVHITTVAEPLIKQCAICTHCNIPSASTKYQYVMLDKQQIRYLK